MFMALALCLTLLPAPVRAAEDTPESGAIVQQEQQEEISPAVSEQAGTNEEENGSEGDPQNTGTPDAGGAEDSKADAPESGEDENAGNNADAAVSAVQTMIDALPIVSELDGMTADELDAAYDDIQAAYDAYEALNAEQQAQITGADFEALLGWFNSQTALLADAQSGEHTHCVCGKDSGTTVNGHTHNNSTAWTAADSARYCWQLLSDAARVGELGCARRRGQPLPERADDQRQNHHRQRQGSRRSDRQRRQI